MSLIHLKNGSMWPHLKPNTLRLYNMHFCPFAQRTRLVLAHKQIEYDLVNVNLQYKPDWFLVRNPLGLVPVLEYNDQVVCGSQVCGDLLEQLYPQKPLYPQDPFEKAHHKMLMENFEQVTSALANMKRSDPVVKQKAFATFSKLIPSFEKHLVKKYFGGSEPGMVDYFMWPWFERLPALQQLIGTDVLSKSDFPKLSMWMKEMLQCPVVKELFIPTDLHIAFFTSLSQKAPKYDLAFSSQSNL